MRKYSIALLMVMLLFAIGCETFQTSSGEDAELYTRKVLYFKDIPVPNSFVWVPGESYSFATDKFRHCNFVYKTKASVLQVARYVDDQFPLAEWRKIAKYHDKGQEVIEFEKNKERATVRITREGNQTKVKIIVYPID